MIIWWNAIKGASGVVNVAPAPADVRLDVAYSVDGVDYVGSLIPAINTFGDDALDGQSLESDLETLC